MLTRVRIESFISGLGWRPTVGTDRAPTRTIPSSGKVFLPDFSKSLPKGLMCFVDMKSAKNVRAINCKTGAVIDRR